MNAKPRRAAQQRYEEERSQARRGVGRLGRGGVQPLGRGGAERLPRGADERPDRGDTRLTGRDGARLTGRDEGPAGRDEARPGRGSGVRALGRRDAQASDAPRPGGRAAARQAFGADGATGPGGPGSTYATRGSAALAPQPAEPASAGRGASRGAPWLKVAPPMPVSVPRAPFVLLLLFVVVGGVLGILVINTKVNENAFKLRNLERQQVALDQQEQDLSKQIAELESPNSLAAQARRLGLVPAGSPAFIRLPDGRIIGVPQPAGGSPSITSGDRQDAGR